MCLNFFRYWKVKLIMRFGPKIDVPPELGARLRQAVDRAAERQSSKKAWEEIRQAQRQRKIGTAPSAPKDCQ